MPSPQASERQVACQGRAVVELGRVPEGGGLGSRV